MTTAPRDRSGHAVNKRHMIRVMLGLLLAALLTPCIRAQSPCAPKDADLRHADLPASIKNDIVTVLAKDVAKDFKKPFPGLPKPSDIALSSCIDFPNLAQNGRVILVNPGPDYPFIVGSAGYEAFWLFRQVGSHAVLILKGVNFDGTEFREFHNGMIDVQTSGQDTPQSPKGWVVVYRFTGKRYLPLYCYDTMEDDKGEHDGPKQPCPE